MAESRAELLDTDAIIDDIIARKGPRRYTEGLSEENWEEELENIPLFMTKSPEEIDPEKAPGLAALQALKYQTDTPAGRASAHKEEGNEHFRLKHYTEAVKEYSAGIREKCGTDMMAILHTNRAAAHLHLGNLRSCVNDASETRKIKPDHLKAFYRGAEALFKLEDYSTAIEWCNDGLGINPEDAKLRELWSKASKEKKSREKGKRKRERKEKEKEKEELKLLEAIKARGIQLASHISMTTEGEGSAAPAMQHKLDCSLPSGERVHFDPSSGELVWPVLFLYPEYGQTDLISAFSEHQRFEDHLDVLFGSDNPPPWDKEGVYTPDNIQIYFEDSLRGGFIGVGPEQTLREAISCKGYTVCEGTPSFILLSAASPFTKQFLKKS